MWLLFLILPGMIHADYLKSTGNIKVLEGETCYLLWDAYTKEQSVAPCHWWYAHDRVEESLIFLAYDGARRFEFGDHARWRFTNIEKPCSGGLHKKAELEDAGVYSMQTDKGILQKTDSEISLAVFKGSDLTITVSVNGKVTVFDLNEHKQSLDLLETHSPVNVSVILSKTFPPTTVIRISNGEEMSCDDPLKECYQVTDLSETSDVSISIKIETDIIGATEILITQPLAYSALVDNRSRNVFAALFFVLLAIIIIIIVYFVQSKRAAAKKSDKDDKMERGEKVSMKQHYRNLRSDIFMACRGKKQLAHHEVLTTAFQQQECALEKELSKVHERINEKIKQLNDYPSSTDDLLNKCQELLNEMKEIEKEIEENKKAKELTHPQHEQYEVLKLQMNAITEVKERLRHINFWCNRIEAIKEMKRDSEKLDIVVAEEATEKTGMMNETHQDILEQLEKIVDSNRELVKLKEKLEEIEDIKDDVNDITDAEIQINNIRDHFYKIRRGWEHAQHGDSVDHDPATQSVASEKEKSKKKKEKSEKKKEKSEKKKEKK